MKLYSISICLAIPHQAFIKWVPSIDPQYINVVFRGKDSPTLGLINIISYDLLPKFTEEVKKKQFQVIIAVSLIFFHYSCLVTVPLLSQVS